MNTKTIAIAVAAILVVAAVGVLIVTNNNDDGEEPKGGLYDLDAAVLKVDMGGVSATPSMVSTIEMLYEAVYGDLVKTADDFNMSDLQADTEFWNSYCNYTSIISPAAGSTYDIETQRYGTINVEESYAMFATGTLYMTTIYYFICVSHGVEPYSDAAKNSAAVKADFQRIVAGGTSLSYVESNTELIDYFDPSKYYDSGVNALRSYNDQEAIGRDVLAVTNSAQYSGQNVIFLAADAMLGSDYDYNGLRSIVQTNGAQDMLFLSASTIKEAFACIECLGILFGYGAQVNDVIEDLQKRLYAVHYSLNEKNEEHKVYWETSAGKAVSSTNMGRKVIEFMGWDASLMDGKEKDLETLLSESPDILIFYSNDQRSADTQMRINQ